jgi:hypothetical protein
LNSKERIEQVLSAAAAIEQQPGLDEMRGVIQRASTAVSALEAILDGLCAAATASLPLLRTVSKLLHTLVGEGSTAMVPAAADAPEQGSEAPSGSRGPVAELLGHVDAAGLGGTQRVTWPRRGAAGSRGRRCGSARPAAAWRRPREREALQRAAAQRGGAHAAGEILPLPFLRYRRVKIQGRGRVRIQVHV